ncbi:hypothetical protein [Streptomyces geranii]|uniref:hypothetical protein n=1 Tax=Streptomyces geranii TaxID=2058923 RepID=UPI000D03784B|nr:hypothetical protein [Streptomyces geranii]
MMFTPRGTPTATDLLGHLQTLLDDYPTYDVTGDEDSVDAVLGFSDLSDPGRFEGALELPLTPGQIQDLVRLVQREQDTQRRAQSDGDQRCGHCGGTGTSGHMDDITHLLVWTPGPGHAEDPADGGWELWDPAEWHAGGTAEARLDGTLADDAVHLLARVAEAIGDDHELTAFQRTTYSVDRVGDRGRVGHWPGTWAFPMFAVQAWPVEEPPADDGSRP